MRWDRFSRSLDYNRLEVGDAVQHHVDEAKSHLVLLRLHPPEHVGRLPHRHAKRFPPAVTIAGLEIPVEGAKLRLRRAFQHLEREHPTVPWGVVFVLEALQNQAIRVNTKPCRITNKMPA